MTQFKFVMPTEKFSGVKSMSLKTYQALLNSEEMQGELINGLTIAQRYTDTTNLIDKRMDLPKFAREQILFLIDNKREIQDCDLLLKTVYLQLVFAHQEMFDSLKDDPIEMSIRHFRTDENNILCKRALDTKIMELNQKKSGSAPVYKKEA